MSNKVCEKSARKASAHDRRDDRSDDGRLDDGSDDGRRLVLRGLEPGGYYLYGVFGPGGHFISNVAISIPLCKITKIFEYSEIFYSDKFEPDFH